ncbi:MAG: TetR/AcrR family transcriptional regulator [Prevotella sp.]|nr:TetR/AcrR family transcriptional regulator [Prevotella sp.]
MQESKQKRQYRQSLHERIIEVAMDSFVKNGIKAVRMDDIAKALMISKRTLYEVYETKELLLYECIKYHHEQKALLLNQYMAEKHNVIEIIVFLYRMRSETYGKMNPLFYEDIVKYPMAWQYLESRKKQSHENFFTFMQQGVNEGFFRNDVNYELISHLFEAIGAYLFGEHLYIKYTHEEMCRNMVFVTLRGFCTEKGVKVLDALLG